MVQVRIAFPGSIQIGYLSAFIQEHPWWTLKPAQGLLLDQPGNETFNRFIGIVASDDQNTILAYTPIQQEIKIRNQRSLKYLAKWFDPLLNNYLDAEIREEKGVLQCTPPQQQDYVLVLEQK